MNGIPTLTMPSNGLVCPITFLWGRIKRPVNRTVWYVTSVFSFYVTVSINFFAWWFSGKYKFLDFYSYCFRLFCIWAYTGNRLVVIFIHYNHLLEAIITKVIYLCKKWGDRVMAIRIIAGPPGSGKSTIVSRLFSKGDILIDLDRIYEAITNLNSHNEKDIDLLKISLCQYVNNNFNYCLFINVNYNK